MLPLMALSLRIETKLHFPVTIHIYLKNSTTVYVNMYLDNTIGDAICLI